MIEQIGNIWDFHSKGRWVVITTNGEIKKDGSNIMGRGIAKQAATKFPKLPYELGSKLAISGNKVYVFDAYKIITLPTKNSWREPSKLELIERSLKELVRWANTPRKHGKFYLPRAGTGNGKLDWKQVKPLFELYLDDRFVVVNEEIK